MIKINKLTVTDRTGAALVSDSVKEYIVAIDPYQDKPFLVSLRGGEVLESYPLLDTTVRSRFAPVFIAVQKGINTCNEFYGKNLLEEITSSVECSEVNGRYTASNVFSYEGREYIACIEKDFSKSIPSYTYTVSGTDLEDLEGYQALYQAVDSEFYPVLADLNRQLEDYIAGKTEEGGQQT